MLWNFWSSYFLLVDGRLFGGRCTWPVVIGRWLVGQLESGRLVDGFRKTLSKHLRLNKHFNDQIVETTIKTVVVSRQWWITFLINRALDLTKLRNVIWEEEGGVVNMDFWKLYEWRKTNSLNIIKLKPKQE